MSCGHARPKLGDRTISLARTSFDASVRHTVALCSANFCSSIDYGDLPVQQGKNFYRPCNIAFERYA
jgi:hypothetical protein